MNARLIAVFSLAIGSSPALAQDPLNLIFYGNSFSQTAGGVHNLVQDIAVAAGHPAPHVYGRLVGGQTLEWHLATGVSHISSGITPGDHWDHIVLQEYSTRPTSHPTNGNIPAFFAAVDGFHTAITDHSPDATVTLFETWARGPGNSVYPSIWPDPAAMQVELRTNYHQAAVNLNSAYGAGSGQIAPVGDGFEAGDFDLSLYAGDIYHASTKGGMLISLVLYGTIYGETNVSSIDLTSVAAGLGINAPDLAEVVAMADAVLCPVDLDHDGLVNLADVTAFIDAFTATDPAADLNADGLINLSDVIAFINAFQAGC